MDLIKPAIDAQVKATLLAALGGINPLIEKLVSEIMNHKVDSDGKPSRYNSDVPWLTWAVNDIVQTAIKDAVKEHLAKHSEKIKAALDAEMRKSKSTLVQSLVTSMTTGIAEAMENNYRITVAFNQR
jgi:hypothetical protein